MNFQRGSLSGCVFAGLLTATWFLSPSFASETAAFRLEKSSHGKKLLAPDGRTVFQYMIRKPAGTNLSANSTCCLYPLNTPQGVRVVDLAPGDHRHHRGVFLAWHAMEFGKRADFWGWGEMAPTDNRRIINRVINLLDANQDYAKLLIKNDWQINKQTVLDEELTITAREKDATYLLDLEYRLTPTENMTLDRSAFGGFCVKSRQDGKRAFFNPQGEVDLPSPHHLQPETDWPNAPFYDYTFTLDAGPIAGITVISHPKNPPTKWHNLLSIAMINPCIVAENSVKVEKGASLFLQYRLIVHDGPRPNALLPVSGN